MKAIFPANGKGTPDHNSCDIISSKMFAFIWKVRMGLSNMEMGTCSVFMEIQDLAKLRGGHLFMRERFLDALRHFYRGSYHLNLCCVAKKLPYANNSKR